MKYKKKDIHCKTYFCIIFTFIVIRSESKNIKSNKIITIFNSLNSKSNYVLLKNVKHKFKYYVYFIIILNHIIYIYT